MPRGLPTAPLAPGLRGAGGGAVDNPLPRIQPGERHALTSLPYTDELRGIRSVTPVTFTETPGHDAETHSSRRPEPIGHDDRNARSRSPKYAQSIAVADGK